MLHLFGRVHFDGKVGGCSQGKRRWNEKLWSHSKVRVILCGWLYETLQNCCQGLTYFRVGESHIVAHDSEADIRCARFVTFNAHTKLSMASHKKRCQSLSVVAPTFTRPLEDVTCSLGDSVTLECHVQGYPRPEVTWEKGGLHIGKSRHIQIERSGQRCVLFLKKCLQKEAGLYICVATNKVGTVSTSARILITGCEEQEEEENWTRRDRQNKLSRSFRGVRRPDITQNGTRSVSVERSKSLRITTPSKSTSSGEKCLQVAEENNTHSTSSDRLQRLRRLLVSDKKKNTAVEKQLQTTMPPTERNSERLKHQLRPSDVRSGDRVINRKPLLTQVKVKGVFKLANKENGSCLKTISNGHVPSTVKIDSVLSNVEVSTTQLENDEIQRVFLPQEGVANRRMQSDESSWESWSGPLGKTERAHFSTVNGHPQLSLNMVSVETTTPARILHGPEDVTALWGDTVTLTVVFCGSPQPLVEWTKGGSTIREDCRTTITVLDTTSILTIHDVTADDSGKYTVRVENCDGGDSHYTSVAVEGPPDPPAGQPNVSDVTDHSVVVSWYSTTYDGGSVVTGYVLEVRCVPSSGWSKLDTVCHNMSFVVDDLEPGLGYIFRVRAENMYGLSKPSRESQVVIIPEKSQCNGDGEETDVEYRTVEVEEGYLFCERYELGEEVGKGRFGTVFRCTEKESRRLQAAKVIRCLKSKEKTKVKREIDIMNRLHHPKLMQLTAAFDSGRNMILVMEYISGGELFDRLVADDYVLTEHDCILFMRQICEAMCYIHQQNVLHLDMKPENILCKSKTSHQIKIIDFGLARVYNPEDEVRVMFGTPEFVAPEVINYDPVTPASDMWSIGVICYVLLSGLSPFMGDSDAETFANITRAEVDFEEGFEAVSDKAKDFMTCLLVKKPQGRLTAANSLHHPWLADSGKESMEVRLSTDKLKKFIIRRKWQKTGNAIRALSRMVSLSGASRSSVSSIDSDSSTTSPQMGRSPVPFGSPHTPRKYYSNRSFTPESVTGSDVFEEEDDPGRQEGMR